MITPYTFGKSLASISIITAVIFLPLVNLTMRAQATHNHTLTLTAAEVTSIAANQRVEKVSSTDDGHDHMVTFN